MATPEVVEANGLPESSSRSQSESRASSISLPAKRKRAEDDAIEDEATAINGTGDHAMVKEATPAPLGPPSPESLQMVRDFLVVLRSHDLKPSLLEFDLPLEATDSLATKSQTPSAEDAKVDGPDGTDEEPKAKRQKSEDKAPATIATETIAHKAGRNGYRDIHDLMLDVNRVVKFRLAELQKTPDAFRKHTNDKAIADILHFQEKAHEYHRRESIYPASSFGPAVSNPIDPTPSLQSNATGNIVLTTYGNAPQGRQLFSSLQRNSSGNVTTLIDAGLPTGLTMTRVVPASPALVDRTERSKRAPTLGEVFAPARVRVPNQPPRKNSKLNVKSNVVTFYHPEEVERADARTANYYTQPISVGRWLDYSNAMPSSQIKTKQRERAQSLAGHRPSTSELEMTEMESLFRGAFSSFAPCKDDTGAMASSGLLGRMWWQRTGSRSFQRMIQAETQKAEGEPAEAVDEVQEDVDEDAIQDLIDHWDEANIDPSLNEVLGKQNKEGTDTDVDEMLQVISDGLETLASFQRNRHLALPTSQDRLSSEPINGDMFMNGLITPPSEAETLQYEALKSQLKLMVSMLPPYAVARINSDKLDDLAISTKIPVHTDAYVGVMEEDDAAVRARQAQQTPGSGALTASSARVMPGHRPQVAPQQFTNVPLPQYVAQNRQAMPSPGFYSPAGQGQAPVRQPISSLPRPLMGQPQLQPQRPGQQYRPNGTSFPGYASQLAKAQTPFGHSNMNTYHSAQGSSRPQSFGPGMPQTPTPAQRYPSYPGSYQQPGGQTTPGAYSGYANGFPANLQQQQRPSSGQYLAQTQQYGQSPGTPTVRPHAMQQGGAATNDPRRPYPQGIKPQVQQARPGQSNQQMMPGTPMGNGQTYGAGQPLPAGDQNQRLLEQARALAAANERSRSFGDKLAQPHGNGGLAGLAGIGLGVGAAPDMQRYVAARAAANMRPATQSPKPRPPPVIPAVVSPVPLPPIAQQISAVQQQLAAQARKEREVLAAQQAQAAGQTKSSTPTPVPPPVLNGTASQSQPVAAASPAAAAGSPAVAKSDPAPLPPPAQMDVKPELGQDQGGPAPMEGVTTGA